MCSRTIAPLHDGTQNRGVLNRFGGVMTLPDVYAVFNRARGTELISPLDLLTVSGMLGPLALGMSLHTFPSGVAVIQVELCLHADTGLLN